jgi:hypothetical protein
MLSFTSGSSGAAFCPFVEIFSQSLLMTVAPRYSNQFRN